MPSAALGEVDALYPQMQRLLVETGEWDRIRSLLFTRLNDHGWVDIMKNNGKERARAVESVSARELFQGLSYDSQSNVPVPVKKDIRSEIRRFMEDQIQNAHS